MAQEKSQSRIPSLEEKAIISFLLEKASLPISYLDEMDVTPMEDGGMGSLKLNTPYSSSISRRNIFIASDLYFKDEDGTIVAISLYVSNGIPYELDVLKMDYSPLISLSNWRKLIN